MTIHCTTLIPGKKPTLSCHIRHYNQFLTTKSFKRNAGSLLKALFLMGWIAAVITHQHFA